MSILALDIGSAQIKCIVADSKWKRYDVIYHDVIAVPDALTEMELGDEILTAGQIQALIEIQRRYTHSISRLVVNIPLSLYSTRVMHFPFKDKKKVTAAVQFQVEDEIPFNIDDSILTTQIFPSKSKEADVLTGVAPLTTLQRYLETLQKIGLDPDVLMAEQSAFYSLLGLQKNSLPGQAVAIVNLGHRKSSFSIYRDGLPVLHRISMNGGFNITKAIAKKYEISLAEAEVAKLDKAFVATPSMQLTPEQQLFSNVIATALDPLLHDFDQALMAFTSRYNQQVDHILLCGGTALLPGLLEVLNERWGKKAILFHVLTRIPHLSIRPQKSTELILPNAIAIGLSQVRSDFRSPINFRSGALKRQQSTLKVDWKQFVGPAKLAFVVYLFALISFGFQTLFLKRDLKDLENKQEQAIKSIVAPPNSSQMTLMKSSPSRLKQNVDKKIAELQAQVQGEGGKSSISTLNILQTLSKYISRGTTVEIHEFNLNGPQLNVKLESPTQKDAESALKMIGAIPSLGIIKTGPIEPATKGRSRISFSIQLVPSKDGA